MKLLFTICGRAGSKGIKNKNIKDFVGFPLPYYTLSAIDLYQKENNEDDVDVVVNSDSKELLEMMQQNPFFRIDTINRAEILGGDDVPKIQVIYNCLSEMEQRYSKKYDMVIDLDITSPLRTKEDVKNLIDTQKEKNADVTFSVTNSRRNPYFNMVKREDKGVKKVLDSNFTTRQQAPEIFDMNASMYAYKPEYLASGMNVLDGYCECIHMYDTGILDLDHENDFELMEVIAQYLFEKKTAFREIFKNLSTKVGANQETVKKVLFQQLKNNFFLSEKEKNVLSNKYIPDAVKHAIISLSSFDNKYFNGEINPYNSVIYCVFLYWLSKVAYNNQDRDLADKIYYLNKMLNSVDLYYAIDLPETWTCEHPVGSVMGRAQYGEKFMFMQGCTVGGNRDKFGEIYYPIIGNNVIMYSNSKVLGKSIVGNNCKISANCYIINEIIPDNSVVFGQSPNLIIKRNK